MPWKGSFDFNTLLKKILYIVSKQFKYLSL